MQKFLMMLAVVLSGTAQADDAELYAPAPPPDSAFVRVAAAGDPPQLSDYRVEPAGEYRDRFTVAAGKFYTLLGKNLLEDAPLSNPAKASVYCYNLSDAKTVAVVAPEHKNAALVEGIKPGASASREVNALTLTLTLLADGREAGTFKAVTLKRRQGVSFLVSGTGPNYRAIQVTNAMAR